MKRSGHHKPARIPKNPQTTAAAQRMHAFCRRHGYKWSIVGPTAGQSGIKTAVWYMGGSPRERVYVHRATHYNGGDYAGAINSVLDDLR